MKFKRIILALFLLPILISSCGDNQVKNTEKERVIMNDSLMTLLQKQTFDYFYYGAESNSGMAPERIHMDNYYPENDQSIVTIGGSGFGVMAVLVGIEREFITREQGYEHLRKIVTFLANADRFHGVWPHWLDGKTGKVKAFSKKDNGGDLVETAFMVQGLLAVSEYFKDGNKKEKILAEDITKLWHEVEWDWYTKGEDVLYWHWSPQYEWEMNFAVTGYNEALIMYVLAASSPTHPVSADVYHKGWAKDGKISDTQVAFNLPTVLDHNSGEAVGPLFWAHYSYLGLNPKGLKDKYGDYWELNKNHALINYRYCVENPKGYKGYGDEQWGLTASYSENGYSGHHIGEGDLGVISPTAALSSFPYTPEESMKFLNYLYTKADTLVGKYGPYDAYSNTSGWYEKRYLAIDQGPIPVMVENYRTGLLWNLFMANKDVQKGLDKLGFEIEE